MLNPQRRAKEWEGLRYNNSSPISPRNDNASSEFEKGGRARARARGGEGEGKGKGASEGTSGGMGIVEYLKRVAYREQVHSLLWALSTQLRSACPSCFSLTVVHVFSHGGDARGAQ